jgi:hypothetical protein
VKTNTRMHTSKTSITIVCHYDKTTHLHRWPFRLADTHRPLEMCSRMKFARRNAAARKKRPPRRTPALTALRQTHRRLRYLRSHHQQQDMALSLPQPQLALEGATADGSSAVTIGRIAQKMKPRVTWSCNISTPSRGSRGRQRGRGIMMGRTTPLRSRTLVITPSPEACHQRGCHRRERRVECRTRLLRVLMAIQRPRRLLNHRLTRSPFAGCSWWRRMDLQGEVDGRAALCFSSAAKLVAPFRKGWGLLSTNVDHFIWRAGDCNISLMMPRAFRLLFISL